MPSLARSRRMLRATAALAIAAMLAPGPGPAAAPIQFHAVIDDSHGQPPFNGSPVRGIGHLTLNDTQDRLSNDVTFDARGKPGQHMQIDMPWGM